MRYKSVLPLAAALGAALVCAACDATAPDVLFPTAHAAATPSCGPADGAALALYFAGEPIATLQLEAPYVGAIIYRPIDSLIGATWSVGTGGSAWLQVAGRTIAVPASEGSIRIVAVAADSTVQGTVNLVFSGAARLTGTFTAKWFPRQTLCG